MTTVNGVFFSATEGVCDICGEPAQWKYHKGPFEIVDPNNWQADLDKGELWCDRCNKLYQLERLRGQVEKLEKEIG